MKKKTVNDLVREVLPKIRLPQRLSYADLLDDAVVPPKRVADKVYALRALIRTGGKNDRLTGRVTSSKDVAEHFKPMLAYERTETLWVVGLDARNQTRFTHCVATGGVTSCAVEARDILRPIILNAAVSLILVHNHPSGEPTPSPEDVTITQRIKDAAALMGVRLLDHIIVGRDGYFSFLDSGLIGAPR